MKKLLVLGCVVAVAVSACGKKGPVVAKIGREKLTTGTLQERIQEAPPSYQGFLSTPAGKKQFVDLLIRERVVLEAARQAGVEGKAEYKKSMADFKKDQTRRARDYQENLAMELYVRDLHEKQLKASDEEVDKYYQEHKSEFDRPVAVVAKHILVPTREEAEKVKARLNQGEDFSKLAAEVSTDRVSAARGGEIGPFRKGDLVPEFEEAVFKLKMNEVSDVVQTQFGYHVIKKISEKPLSPLSPDQAKLEIRRILEKTKFDQWYTDAKKKFGVTVNYDALSQLTVPQAAPQNEAQPPAAGAPGTSGPVKK